MNKSNNKVEGLTEFILSTTEQCAVVSVAGLIYPEMSES
jgi:hypothetical protein